METLEWRGDELYSEQGAIVARLSADVIEIDSQRLLVESSLGTTLGFRLRATGAGGTVFTMRKTSFTVQCLEADCDGRHYTINRTSRWRKQREIVSGDRVMAKISALVGGTLRVTEIDPAIPLGDLVFLSYGCLLVDVNVRDTRY